MMKYAWLPALILLGAVGCHSEAYYREQAVESAREFIYKHARELTAEQYSVVKFNPPVILYGPIFKAVGTFQPRESVLGEEQHQICVTWRIPGAETDYLVYGVSEPRMVYWKPLRLIRRRIAPAPKGPAWALTTARQYAVTSLDGQLSFADLNKVRFTHPSLLLTAFPLQGMQEGDEAAPKTADGSGDQAPRPAGVRKTSPRDGFVSGGIPPVESPVEVAPQVQPPKEEVKPPFPRPWHLIAVPREGRKDLVQLSLVWKIGGDRSVVFCGVGKEDLSSWTICQVGIVGKNELAENTVKELRPPEKFLFKPGKDDEEEDLDAIIVQAQPRSEPAASEREESDDDSDSGAAEAAPARKDSGKLPKGKKAGEKDGKSRRSGDDPEKGV